MVTRDISAVLPKGVGQLPEWWLENVLHDIRDDVLKIKRRMSRRFLGLPTEGPEHEKQAIEMEKMRLDSISTHSKAAGISNPEVLEYDASKNGDESILASLAASEKEMMDGSSSKDSNSFFSITMTSAEEAATVERRRQKDATAEKYGQNKLKKRDGNVKTVDELLVNRDQYGNSFQQSPSAEKSSPGQQHMLASAATTRSAVSGGSKKSSTPIAKKYQTEFTGLSPFDFAMQQRANEKERREKERLAKEALGTHHGHSLAADRAAQSKAKDQEARQKKKDAEDNLKAFKAADLDKQYEVATELKKPHLEEMQKKREAEEHLKGYSER